MAAQDQIRFSKQKLRRFQRDYQHNGKLDLDIQVPHLARLAGHYQRRYKITKNWTDCVKAHALYNSVCTREPLSPGWKERVFEVQQDYLEDKCLCSFEKQQSLTSSFSDELELIRNQCRQDMVVAKNLSNEINGADIEANLIRNFFTCMQQSSISCSERMTALAGRIIRESIGMLHPAQPPCDFVAIAIGSLARGEATPYSDLEYIFLIEEPSEISKEYFEKLAITTYFQIGNLGETALNNMSIKELRGWFDDKAKNGFRIDGLSKQAGNIPTGNGSSHERNHFIVTPKGLAERYQTTLEEPDLRDALRGDLTAMLTYMKTIFSHPVQNELLTSLQHRISEAHLNDRRRKINKEMLNTDVLKFNFQPSGALVQKGFAVDVKKEIFRFPSILLLDIAIITQTVADNSWSSLEALLVDKKISDELHIVLQFLLATAAYMRLSAYLFHDSQDERISVGKKSTRLIESQMKGGRWLVHGGIFITMCNKMIMLKRVLYEKDKFALDFRALALEGDESWTHVTTLVYTGRYTEALAKLKEMFGEKVCTDPLSIIQNLPTGQTKLETLDIISETLYCCNEHRSALLVYKHITDNDIKDKKDKIAQCHTCLGEYKEAMAVLESIPDKSAEIWYSLGQVYLRLTEYDEKSEQAFVQALDYFYSDISSEKLYDYYGEPLETDEPMEIEKLTLVDIASPEDRLSRVINSSPDVVLCISALGYVYNNQGKYTYAEAYYKKSLQLISQLYGEGAIVNVARSAHNNLGLNYTDMGQYSLAETHHNQSIDIARELSLGADTLNVASSMYNMGLNFKCSGRFSEAEDYYRRSVALLIKLSQGIESNDIAQKLIKRANKCNKTQRYAEAIDHFNNSLALSRGLTKSPNNSYNIVKALNGLGSNYKDMGEYGEAEKHYKQALEVYRELSGGDDSNETADILIDLGYSYRDAGNESKALETLREALDMYIRVDPDNLKISQIQEFLSSDRKAEKTE